MGYQRLSSDNIGSVLPEATSYKTDKKQVFDDEGNRHTLEYIRVPMSFDLESYSFRDHGARRSVMWAWGVGIGEDTVYIGRTWGQFVEFWETLSEKWGLSEYRRVLVYVHNLAYDFQFFRKWCPVTKVFSLEPRRACYVETAWGVEFRCSYLLTGYSLEKVGEHLTGHNIRKLSGEIDYNLPRHSETQLSPEELQYLEHDCLVVCCHIQECIDREGGIQKIPLTKTGYVRRLTRKACFTNPNKVRGKKDYTCWRYQQFMKGLTLDRFLYDQARAAFQGGYTHANPWYSTKEPLEQVSSYDFTSSYPAVMVSELFPMTPPSMVEGPMTKEEFNEYINLYCCIFTARFEGLESRFDQDHYISESHAVLEGNRQISNGRIVWADTCTVTITEQDYKIIRKTYKWKVLQVSGFMRFGRGYLPRPIVQTVMELYQQKTELKGVPGKEQEYLSAKELLNSVYGMMVQNPLRPDIPYDLEDEEWGYPLEEGSRQLEVPPDKDEALEKYNQDSKRFLWYLWGVYVTAYARRNLWTGILECGEDYIYSDTDSIKILNHEKHQDYFTRYNAAITGQIEACLDYYHMDRGLACPQTVKGVSKPLGVWDYEGTYKRFKTLGAKRYMTEDQQGTISITVSGLNKKTAVPYLLEQARERGADVFDLFQDDMDIPAPYSGKLVPFYIDSETAGAVTDHQGNTIIYHEKSSVCMEGVPYHLSLSAQYVAYLKLLIRGHF